MMRFPERLHASSFKSSWVLVHYKLQLVYGVMLDLFYLQHDRLGLPMFELFGY